jgi:hypothetical protein
MTFPTTVDRADPCSRLTPPSPIPCHAWHGNSVTIARHEEGGVCANGHASANPSGVGADALPAGAKVLY